jgi:hypothetical protein
MLVTVGHKFQTSHAGSSPGFARTPPELVTSRETPP